VSQRRSKIALFVLRNFGKSFVIRRFLVLVNSPRDLLSSQNYPIAVKYWLSLYKFHQATVTTDNLQTLAMLGSSTGIKIKTATIC
jgi:hypothetical protein